MAKPLMDYRGHKGYSICPVTSSMDRVLRPSEIVVGQSWIQNRVAVVLEIGRLYAAWSRLPAVEEEEGHSHDHLGVESPSRWRVVSSSTA